MAVNVPNAFKTNAGPKYQSYNSSANKNGIGGLVGNFLGFDITPNHNLTSRGFVYNGPVKAKSTKQSTTPKNTEQTNTAPVTDSYAGAGGYGGYGGGGGGYAAVDPATAAYYDSQISKINSNLGRFDNQLNIGRDNINNAINTGVNTLNTGYARAQRDYGVNRQDTINNNIKAKQGIDSSVRQQTSALQRLLGSAGAGNSSAAQVLAPYAAARQGSIQRSQVQDNYGKNLRGLDTSFQDTTYDYNNQKSGLETQRRQKMNELQASIEQNRANLLDQLSSFVASRAQAQGKSMQQALAESAGYDSQVNSILNNIDNLGRQYASPVSVRDVKFKAPELASYDTEMAKIGANVDPNAEAYSDQITPYQVLLGLKKDEQQNQVLA